MVGGSRGPIPKRSDQRRRQNKETDPDVVTLPVMPEVAPDPADESWHPAVRNLYESLAKSGQAQFFEPSDWAFARLTCEILSRGVSAEKMPAMIIASCMADLARLGVTEGDRRRMRIELERVPDEEVKASVLIMGKYRDRRASGN